MAFKKEPVKNSGLSQIIMLCLIVLAVCIIIYAIARPSPHPVSTDTIYKATDNPGLAMWVRQVVPNITSFSPQNADEKLAASRKYFTKDGWEGFTQALHDADIINIVKQNNKIYTIDLRGASVVGKADGNIDPPVWRVVTPASLAILPEDHMLLSRVKLVLQVVGTDAANYKIMQWATISEHSPDGVF